MKISLVLLSLSVGAALAAESPVAPGATATKVADGFKFTEGPSVDAQGNVFFTDQPNNRIHRWDAKTGKVTVAMEPAGRSNGLCFAPDGKLWACADEKNELWVIDPATGKHEVILADFEGKLFNGPNDVWVRPDGGVYFTDPFFKRPYWTRGPEEQPSKQVYYVAPGAKSAVRVTKDMWVPNGLVGSPDGKTLYVADPGKKKVFAYDIQPDGSLTNARPFCDGVADGITLDEEGNLYLAAAKAVTIVDKNGVKIGEIAIPENWTANVCFGGADMKTLFVTASKGVYTVPMRVKGAARQ